MSKICVGGSGFDPRTSTILRQEGICLSGDISLDLVATLSLQNTYIEKDHVFHRLPVSDNKPVNSSVT